MKITVTPARRTASSAVTAPGMGNGLHGAAEMLRTRKGEELQALQLKLAEPLQHLDRVFQAAESGQLGDLTKAMSAAEKEINQALRK